MSVTDQVLEMLRAHVGKPLPPGQWHQIDQEQINRFADAALDHNYIHVDRERAAASSFGSTIAHGFLTLSLVAPLVRTVSWPEPNPFKHVAMSINYGVDRVRFVSPVRAGARIRPRSVILDVELKAPRTLDLKQEITMELEGGQKPACVAVWILRLIYES